MGNPPNALITSETLGHGLQRVLAAAVSSIVPGIGQLLLGKTRTGIGFLCAYGLLVLLYWPLRLPRSYFGMQVVVFLTVGLFVLSGWHTLRTRSQRTLPGSRWWLVLLVPLAFKASFWSDTRLLPLISFYAFDVPSNAMEPTLLVGDRVIADRSSYRDSKPKPNDIVVIRRDGTFLIKRVVATSGESVEGKGDLIFVNGQLLKEPYVEHTGDATHLYLNTRQFGPVIVLPEQLFVLGDNRDNSIDSRTPEFGPVTESNVTGKVLYVVRRPRWWRAGLDVVANILRSLRPDGHQ